MAFFYFLLGEKLKKWKFSISFQIYVPYDLKNQACNIYKYRTYNANVIKVWPPKEKSLGTNFDLKELNVSM